MGDADMDLAEELTPYATAFRYPGDILEPNPLDAKEAFHLAEKVLGFILNKLPERYREVAATQTSVSGEAPLPMSDQDK
jgi:hypothetical protein